MKADSHEDELQRLKIVVARDPCDMDEVGRIRYAAYRSVDAIESNTTERFLDCFDELANHQSHLLICNEIPIGSIRSCIYNDFYSWSKTGCMEIFHEELCSHIGSRTSFVESNRFTVDPTSRLAFSRRCFVLFKAILLAAMAHEIRWIVTAVRDEHCAFYERTLGFERISNLKRYPGLQFSTVLLAGDVYAQELKVRKRHSTLSINTEDLEAYRRQSPVCC